MSFALTPNSLAGTNAVFTMLCSTLAFGNFALVADAIYISSLDEHFLQPRTHALHSVAAEDVMALLLTSVSATAGEGTDELPKRVAAIEASVRPIFQALPKNSWGNLPHHAMSYVAQRYFSREHQQHLNGLTPSGHTHAVRKLDDVTILQDKAPGLLEDFLESQAPRGLTLRESAAFVTTVERLIKNDTLTVLQNAYALNRITPEDHVDLGQLSSILSLYSNLAGLFQEDSLEGHSEVGAMSDFFQLGMNLALAHMDSDKANSSVPYRYSFTAVAEIVERLRERFGEQQNSDCVEMRNILMSLDPNATGRAPLDEAYGINLQNATFRIAESPESLRADGALDDSDPEKPNLLISNYVLGRPNCYKSSTYYSYCCLNECDRVLHAVESSIQAPSAPPEFLLEMMTTISTSTVKAPRDVPRQLVDKLYEIARRHDGQVPIHGRLFAQFLHYLFPHQCPYPFSGLGFEGSGPSELLEVRTSSASLEEEQGRQPSLATDTGQVESCLPQWTDDEHLPLAMPLDVPDDYQLHHVVRVALECVVLLALGRFLFMLRKKTVGGFGEEDAELLTDRPAKPALPDLAAQSV